MIRCPRCEKAYDDDDEAPPACEVCGAPLPRSAPAAAPPSPAPRAQYTELAKVFEARSEGELALVQAILSAAGIAAFAVGEHIRLTRPNVDSPRAILVPAERVQPALEALRRQGVVPGVVDAEDLDRVWVGAVAPLLAAPGAAQLAAEIGWRDPSFRAALFSDLEAAGRRGLDLFVDLALALGLRGPSAAAREAAAHLATSEALRDRRGEVATALGALVRRHSPADTAVRVATMLERLRGSVEAERALVPLLEHDEVAVRDAAIEALYSVSGGETLGFEPDAPAEERAAAVERWWARLGGRLPR